ncbi:MULTISPECIES: JAB domain-containing protein [Sphingobium]|uniref:JAB domain-containing protein n=1 Tax=Sphingobium sp. MI1205 TaxID=407020 RepID=UPI000781C283|nr:JAB domain-containing protein [Sphingobium sp. MI1205]
MNPTESTQFLLLDNDWRPLRRVTADDGWHCVVHELLKLDSQWLIIEQQRFDDQAPVPRWDDIRLSRAISRRLRPMDVKLADHVIRGSGDQFSFRAAGLL